MVKKNYAFGLPGDDIHQIIQWKYPVFHQKSECYISFVCFDPAQGKLRAKKIMLDHIKGKRKQRDYAEQLINRIVKKLMNGWNPWLSASQPLEYTLFDDVLERYKRYLEKLCNDHNLRKESFIDYSSRVRILERWKKEKNIQLTFAYQFDRHIISEFLDYIFLDRNNTITTRNNYLGRISRQKALFERHPRSL